MVPWLSLLAAGQDYWACICRIRKFLGLQINRVVFRLSRYPFLHALWTLGVICFISSLVCFCCSCLCHASLSSVVSLSLGRLLLVRNVSLLCLASFFTFRVLLHFDFFVPFSISARLQFSLSLSLAPLLSLVVDLIPNKGNHVQTEPDDGSPGLSTPCLSLWGDNLWDYTSGKNPCLGQWLRRRIEWQERAASLYGERGEDCTARAPKLWEQAKAHVVLKMD